MVQLLDIDLYCTQIRVHVILCGNKNIKLDIEH